jgi:hypothetical protein
MALRKPFGGLIARHYLLLPLTCRRQKDIQKLSQAILLANDQRLMALRIREHQEQQLQASSTVCHY